MLNKILYGDLVGITVSKLIVTFGTGLVVVFIPLLFLQHGMKLWQVCVFYVAYAFFKLGVNYPSAQLINHYGARLGLVVGTLATAAFMLTLTLYISYESITLAALMAALLAVQNSFTWNSQHLFIARAMQTERKGRDLATIESLGRIVSVFTPITGGLIAAYWGQTWLTLIATAALLAAIVPIWRIDSLAGGHQKITKLRYSLRYAPPRDLIANFGFNAHTLVGAMVWPIYLAIFIPDFRSIGIITSIASIIAVIVMQIAGRRGDRGKAYRVLIEGTGLSSIAHIARVLASSNPLSITLISAFYDIALSYQQNPWTSLYYTHTRDGGINYIMSMEITGDLAYLTMWGMLGAIAYTTGDTSFFTVAFGIAAVAAWLCLFMRREQPLTRAMV